MAGCLERVRCGESINSVGLSLLLQIAQLPSEKSQLITGFFYKVHENEQISRIAKIANEGVCHQSVMTFFSQAKCLVLVDVLLFIVLYTEAWGDQWRDKVHTAFSQCVIGAGREDVLREYDFVIKYLSSSHSDLKFAQSLLEKKPVFGGGHVRPISPVAASQFVAGQDGHHPFEAYKLLHGGGISKQGSSGAGLFVPPNSKRTSSGESGRPLAKKAIPQFAAARSNVFQGGGHPFEAYKVLHGDGSGVPIDAKRASSGEAGRPPAKRVGSS